MVLGIVSYASVDFIRFVLTYMVHTCRITFASNNQRGIVLDPRHRSVGTYFFFKVLSPGYVTSEASREASKKGVYVIVALFPRFIRSGCGLHGLHRISMLRRISRHKIVGIFVPY